MTGEKARSLGLRAAAASGWRCEGGRYLDDGLAVRADDGILWRWFLSDAPEACWPDLRDPATVGCLLVMVRKAWGHSLAYIYTSEEQVGHGPERGFPEPIKMWGVVLGQNAEGVGCGDTEAEALVAALEAAP